MPEWRDGLPRRLEPALLAAAITPGLRSILLFGANRMILDTATSALEQMLKRATGRDVVSGYLGSGQQEDDLWIRPYLSSRDGRLSVEFRHGALSRGIDETQLPLLVIPDLAELSLAAARGAVALIGASVAHLERHGASLRWPPDACWLAACDRAAIGKVSPHLLDRFALRLDAELALSPQDRVADMRRWALGEPERPHLLSEWATRSLSAAVAVRPEVLPEALERVAAVAVPGDSPRREIALARLAAACARLEGSGSVGQQHVDQAAGLIGLRLPGSDPDREETETAKPEVTDQRPPATGGGSINHPAGPEHGKEEGEEEGEANRHVAISADPPRSLPEQAELPGQLAGPYPEDHAVADRDMTSLRDVPARFHAVTVPRGPIIGVRQAADVHDLALLSTVLTAAIWAPYRRLHATGWPDGGGIRLLPADLRGYRRAPAPERLLALVIDYTCLDGWDWTAPLLPYLHQAYVERAGIVLVRVGAKSSGTDEKRADRLITRNLLDPRLDARLDAVPARATPLAHGLFLALQSLKHGLQHGAGNVRTARLVVITDGRGNVPLGSEPTAATTVGRIGVEDALKVAADIRAIAAIETILIDPEPDVYPELVSELARALGAERIPGRSSRPAVETDTTP